ncbi:MAG: hypothetical protein GF404_13680 [candidate division Zixibacteria bacterium]|nr:hypothetical protein [candidate division Zixibacteria bacterium]
MFKYVKYIVLFSACVLLLSCAGAKKEVDKYPPESKVGPSELKVRSDNRTLFLSWRTNRTEDMLISGYNIYISTQPLLSPGDPERIKPGIEPVNDIPYPGDEDPQISYETYEARDLQNWQTYHVAVTTVFPDMTESSPSNVVEASCYPRGTVTLKDRMMEDMDGYSFELGEHVAYNALENDLYFVARDVGNILGSPDRNDGVLKHTRFAHIPAENELNTSRDYSNLSYDNKTFVAEGQVYMLRLSDGTYVKLRVRNLVSTDFIKQVTFDYIYLGP